MLSDLATKYRREVGLEPTLRRLEVAAKFLKRLNLQPSEARFEQHIDPLWNKRKVREPHERKAILIGSSSYRSKEKGSVNERWWLVPKPEAIKSAEEEVA